MGKKKKIGCGQRALTQMALPPCKSKVESEVMGSTLPKCRSITIKIIH